ncbi:MAG: NepR family anti-sigma factor [Roseovarius sp.]
MPDEDPKNTDGRGEDADRTSEMDRQITENLRKLYQSTVDEELPASLRDLIERLKAQDRGNG